MYEARSVFSEIQLQCFYISGRLITQDEFISLINNKIKEIEKMHVYDYEKRKELIKFLSEFIQAIISNDTIKYTLLIKSADFKSFVEVPTKN